jgi:act minimal PKS ketosynthase (KS/KS alpha)
VTRRVVITGLGAVAPGGAPGGVKSYWNLLTSGRSATRIITAFDPSPFRTRIAAECDFDPETAGLSPAEIDRMDRAAQFVVTAGREAIRDSGLDLAAVDPGRIGVSVGCAVGCTTSMEREYRAASGDGDRWLVDPCATGADLYDRFVPSSVAAELARTVMARGPVTLLSNGCTSGLDAVGHGADLIREGSADVVVAAGTDAPISPITLSCFDSIKATTARNDDPEGACRPFDATRNGLVLGEGAAVLMLEEYEAARRRSAPIYAEVAGFASRCNAYHMTGLREDGAELAEAIRCALDEAQLAPSAVDYVNAHGSSTKQNDRHETAAFKRALGEHAYNVPVSSIKSMIGHSLGAIGALELAACALTIVHGVIPPTANLHHPDPELDLDYVPNEAREANVDSVLSVGSGFGGFQSAVVLTRGGK